MLTVYITLQETLKYYIPHVINCVGSTPRLKWTRIYNTAHCRRCLSAVPVGFYVSLNVCVGLETQDPADLYSKPISFSPICHLFFVLNRVEKSFVIIFHIDDHMVLQACFTF